jgi:hypothetical protein
MRQLLRCLPGSFVVSYICYVHISAFNVRLIGSAQAEAGGSPSPLLISVCPKTSVLSLIYFRVVYGSELPKEPCAYPKFGCSDC